jgi:hypothetical protein
MLGETHGGEAMPQAKQTEPVIIKLYARKRLYDTADGNYVSLDILRDWAVEGVLFKVVDAETGADVTRVLMPRGKKRPAEPYADRLQATRSRPYRTGWY